MRTHKVLIPLDGSAFSRQSLPVIRRLLPPEHYALLLLHVADAPTVISAALPHMLPVGPIRVPIYEHAQQDAEPVRHPLYADYVQETVQAELEDELHAIAHTLEGYDVTIAVRFGDPSEEIVACAADEHVDLVVMATHGRTGVRQVVLGSVANAVLCHVEVPVLLFRPQEEAAAATLGERTLFF